MKQNHSIWGNAAIVIFTLIFMLVGCPSPSNDNKGNVRVWKQETDASWSGRYGHTTVVFDDKLWVLGGASVGFENDVWSSKDGVNWTEVKVTGSTWSGRRGHTTVAFDKKIWVLGGHPGGNTSKNDVWSSSDGETWTEVTTAGSTWSGRSGHTTVVFDKKIWVLGGHEQVNGIYSLKNDVWSSSDGKTWTEVKVTGSTWSGRWGHTTVAFDKKIWVLGGSDDVKSGSLKNDVWSSSDGVNWTKVKVTGSTWSGRLGHTTVVFDDKLWVLGGEKSGSSKNDVWSSSDGKTWTEVTTAGSTKWSGRSEHTTVVFGDKLWVLGGEKSGSLKNDVWSYGLP